MGIIGTLRAKLDSAIDSITVIADALDIRHLDSSTDSATVVAEDLDIRDLSSATDSVDVSGSAVTVSATDLDIRNLVFATDKVDTSDSAHTINDIQWVDGNSGVDASTNTLQTITYEHHEIHAGSHFNYCDYDTALGINDTLEFILTTPNTTKWTHLAFEVYSSTGATVELYEGTTGVTGGTSITPRNNNRNSVTASTITLVKDPASITVDGTRAAGYLAGGAKQGGDARREREYVLRQNTAYLVRITSLAASNNVSWCAEWYEHTDKN